MAPTTPTTAPFTLQQQDETARKKAKSTARENPNAKAARKRQEKQQRDNTAFIATAPIHPDEESFRHAHWKDKRRRVLIALNQSGATANVIEAFQNCGAICSVEFNKEEQRYRLRGQYCKNRHCEPCMKAKANLLAMNLQKKVADSPGKQFRFVTLTLRHTDTPLADQLDRLTACFRKLRNSKVWKETQTGGAVMLEVKYSQDTGEWHPHLHIVAEGYFLDHKDLSAAWHAITGDSFKVDIRSIKSAKDASYYVAKYVSKGSNDDVYYTPHIAVEWIAAMKGRRTCQTYGSWRTLKLLESPPDTGEWKKIGGLADIMYRASLGETWAIKLIDTLRRDCQYNPHRKRTSTLSPLPVVSS